MASTAPVCDFGWPAIDAMLPGVDGASHRLFDLAGPNGLVIAFICNHCPYVQAVIDRIVRDAADLKPEGVGFVAISSNDADAYPADSFENMAVFAAAHRFGFPYLYDADQSVARAYGAACTPDFFGFNGAAETAVSRPPRRLAQAGRASRPAPRPLRSHAAGCPHRRGSARPDRLDRLLDQMEGRRVTNTSGTMTLKRPRAVLFDLDGTLIDSAPDLAASVNIVLGLHGFTPLTLAGGRRHDRQRHPQAGGARLRRQRRRALAGRTRRGL